VTWRRAPAGRALLLLEAAEEEEELGLEGVLVPVLGRSWPGTVLLDDSNTLRRVEALGEASASGTSLPTPRGPSTTM